MKELYNMGTGYLSFKYFASIINCEAYYDL